VLLRHITRHPWDELLRWSLTGSIAIRLLGSAGDPARRPNT
jgi:hypothetical protein